MKKYFAIVVGLGGLFSGGLSGLVMAHQSARYNDFHNSVDIEMMTLDDYELNDAPIPQDTIQDPLSEHSTVNAQRFLSSRISNAGVEAYPVIQVTENKSVQIIESFGDAGGHHVESSNGWYNPDNHSLELGLARNNNHSIVGNILTEGSRATGARILQNNYSLSNISEATLLGDNNSYTINYSARGWDSGNNRRKHYGQITPQELVDEIPDVDHLISRQFTNIYAAATANVRSSSNKIYYDNYYGIARLSYTEVRNELVERDFSSILPYLITVNKTSTQYTDLTNGGANWTSKDNPPTFNVGWNNDLFLAYDQLSWNDEKKNVVASTTSLNQEQKEIMYGLLNEYKLDDSNYDDVYEAVINNASVTNVLPRTWSRYLTNDEYDIWDAESFKTINIVTWLNTNAGMSGNNTVRNYDLLSHFIRNQESIKIDYSMDEHDYDIELAHGELIDYSIDIINTKTTLDPAQIKINWIEFYTYSPIYNITKTTRTQVFTDVDFNQYHIDWDRNTQTYSVKYQPNPLDISEGTYFFPRDIEDVRYNDQFEKEVYENDNWVATGELGYEAILYRYDNNYIPFTSDGTSNTLNWEATTIRAGQTQKETLSSFLSREGAVYSADNVWVVTSSEIDMIINPYQDSIDTGDGGYYLTNPAYRVQRILNTLDGRTEIVIDYDDDRLSNRFNNGFGIDRNGIPNGEGTFTDGIHSIEVLLENYPAGDKIHNIAIMSSPLNPVIDNTETISNNELYYQEHTGEYKRIYTSTTEVATSLEGIGIKDAELSFVDSEGYWYNMPLDVNSIVNGGELMDRVSIIIDFQGLFRVTYENIAGIQEQFYLWIQRPTLDENQNQILANIDILETGQENLLGELSTHLASTYWFSEATHNNEILDIRNMLISDLEIQQRNYGWWGETQLAEVVSRKQTNSSVGGDINNPNNPHSLAGDELKFIIDDSVIKDPNPTEEFYQHSINVLGNGHFRVSVENNLFEMNNLGEFVPISHEIEFIVNDSYDIVSSGHQSEAYANVWHGVTLFDHDVEYNDDFIFEVNELWEDQWDGWEYSTQIWGSAYFDGNIRYDGVASSISLIEDWISDIEIRWSPLWYEWYQGGYETYYDEDEIDFKREGRYEISYTDITGHTFSMDYIIFDYPRDFSTYTAQDGQIWYNTTPIAYQQEKSTYKVTGEWSDDDPFDGSDQVAKTFLRADYDVEIIVEGDLAPVFSQNWLNVTLDSHDNEVIDEDTGAVIDTYSTWNIVGQGTSDVPIDFGEIIEGDTDMVSTYYLDGYFSGQSVNNIPTYLNREFDSSIAMTPEELWEGSFLGGDWINLYEASGGREGFLIDHDNDPSTADVAVLENWNHYQYQYSEYISGGNDPEDWWPDKEDPEFGSPDEDGSVTNPPGEDDGITDAGGLPAQVRVGIVIGGLFGGLGTIGFAMYLRGKRKSNTFGR